MNNLGYNNIGRKKNQKIIFFADSSIANWLNSKNYQKNNTFVILTSLIGIVTNKNQFLKN